MEDDLLKIEACKMLKTVPDTLKQALLDLMLACPREWREIQYNQLSSDQRDALKYLVDAGYIQLEYTSLMNDKFYNVNWKIITQCTGFYGLPQASDDISIRFRSQYKEQVKKAKEATGKAPAPNMSVQKICYMATDEGVKFSDLIKKQDKEWRFYLWYALFPEKHEEFDLYNEMPDWKQASFGKIISITDLNENPEHSQKITSREYDNIMKTMKDYHNEDMDAHKYTHSIKEDQNKHRHEKWATVPECVRAVFDMIAVEQNDGKYIDNPTNNRDGMRLKVQGLLKENNKRILKKGSRHYYNVADIAEAIFSYYKEFGINQYITEFKVFAKTADQLGLNITERPKSEG